MNAETAFPGSSVVALPAGNAMVDAIGDAIASAMIVGLEAGRQSGVLAIDRPRLSVIVTDNDGPEDLPQELVAESLFATEADAKVESGNLTPSPISESSLAEIGRAPVCIQGEIEDDLQRQRSLVAELSLEVAQASAQLKSLREELKTQIQVLAEMEPGGPRGTQLSRHPDSHVAIDPSRDSRDGTTGDRPGPPDSAGDTPISQAFTVSPGVLEKLAGQGVETVAELEAYMRAGRLVPGRVKGIGQIAIDKIKDRLLEYRAKNPVPTWEDVRGGDARREDDAGEAAGECTVVTQDMDSPATATPAAEADRPASTANFDNRPEGPILEVFAVDQIIPMLDELIAEEERLDREGDDEELRSENPVANEAVWGSSASEALPESLPESQADPECQPGLAGASQEPVAADPSVTPRERLGGQDKKQVGLLFRDGTPVDMVQYRNGQKAANEMEDVGANPHPQGTILWRSWDLGWQDSQ